MIFDFRFSIADLKRHPKLRRFGRSAARAARERRSWQDRERDEYGAVFYPLICAVRAEEANLVRVRKAQTMLRRAK